MSGIVIEWAPFTLSPGATEAQLLEASDALQTDFLVGQEGFVRRELLRQDGRQWCDLVYWRDAQTAQRAMERAAQSPVCLRYFQLMVGPEGQDPAAGVQHFVLQRSYAS